MTAIAASSAFARSDGDPRQFEQLAMELSSRFTGLHLDGIEPAIAAALERVGRTLGVDSSSLLELADAGTASVVATWIRPGAIDADPMTRPGLLGRLAENERVSVRCGEPLGAHAGIGGGGASAACAPVGAPRGAMLGIPIAFGGRVTCALVLIDGRPHHWPAAVLERIGLVAEILVSALRRSRQDSALRASLAEIERLNARLKADNVYLQEEIKSHHDFDEIVGESRALSVALTRLRQVAPMHASVLLLGETGTGKELFARALHDRSGRRARALVRVNCAALPPTLVESELFGHEKGAFTGAATLRQGRFELADGGTIFLDEIGDLSFEIQAKLLRVLQEGEFERVGSSRTRKVDVRVIAATHRDLEADVADGRFRADLFYRLSVYPIRLPALRERREDIPSLVWFFIHCHQRELGRRISKVPQAVMQTLQHHDWPGNVRELENVVERAMIHSTGDALELDDTFGTSRRAIPVTTTGSLDAVQRTHIESVLHECGWRINGMNNAAERLGLHPNTLRFRMKKLGIVAPYPRPRL